MNTGITISFIIGGLLLISIITLNARVVENSGEAVLNMSAKQKVETVSQVMTHDFLRIGYNTGDEPANAIKNITANPAGKIYRIEFEADINDNNTADPVIITWEWKGKDNTRKVTATENDADYELRRTVTGGGSPETYNYAVTDFTFEFINENKSVTTNPKAVKIINVTLVTQAPEKYGSRNGYETSIWQKTFTPPNLNMYRYN